MPQILLRFTRKCRTAFVGLTRPQPLLRAFARRPARQAGCGTGPARGRPRGGARLHRGRPGRHGPGTRARGRPDARRLILVKSPREAFPRLLAWRRNRAPRASPPFPQVRRSSPAGPRGSAGFSFALLDFAYPKAKSAVRTHVAPSIPGSCGCEFFVCDSSTSANGSRSLRGSHTERANCAMSSEAS